MKEKSKEKSIIKITLKAGNKENAPPVMVADIMITMVLHFAELVMALGKKGINQMKEKIKMNKLTNEERERLLHKALTLCENASYLLDKCYKAHCKEVEKRKREQ